MAKSGLTHIDVGPELTRTEWESEETHALINGTSFPGSPVERQLFYRNDLHEWYIYTGSAWASLQGAGGGLVVHDNAFHTPDYEEEGVAATQIETHRTTAVHAADQPPDVHDNAKHSPDFEEEGVAATQIETHRTTAVHAADQPPDLHDNAKHSPDFEEEGVAAGLVSDHEAAADPHTGYTKHSLATAVSDFLVASGVGVFVKKTLAEVKTLLDWAADIATHAGLTTGTHGVGAGTIWHGGLTDIVDKTHLSQDFGASATRLRNLIVEPIAGEILRINPCSSTSPFSASIAGNPTSTSVVYDGETNEGMFAALSSGAGFWGRIILHNTTRSNSRKIVSVNVGTNSITTEDTSDDWADDDVITVQSQTNAQAGYFDVDVSAEVASTVDGFYLFATLDDLEGELDNSRYVMFHPYEAYDGGKRQWINANLANIKGQGVYPLKIISQKFTMWIGSGVVSVAITMSVKGTFEYADV